MEQKNEVKKAWHAPEVVELSVTVGTANNMGFGMDGGLLSTNAS